VTYVNGEARRPEAGGTEGGEKTWLAARLGGRHGCTQMGTDGKAHRPGCAACHGEAFAFAAHSAEAAASAAKAGKAMADGLAKPGGDHCGQVRIDKEYAWKWI
jgi:hypothetical protein